MNDLIALAQTVIDIEVQALSSLKSRLGEEFIQACHLMLTCKGKVVVLGIGKSSYIGAKIAASLASTGTPAFFIHAAEAGHGDLGMISQTDIVVAISNSGETQELVSVIPTLKHIGVQLIAICGRRESSLGLAADIFLDASVAEEACPLGLAPTASTTVALALGDALAVALLKKRGFTPVDFARTHPGGSLGKRLLLKVRDLMHTGSDLPLVRQNMRLGEVLIEVTQKKLGFAIVVDDHNKAIGIFTDGDLRRALDRAHPDLKNIPITEVMTPGGKTIDVDALATEALMLMEKYKITAIMILDNKHCPLGVIHMHDLLRAGVN